MDSAINSGRPLSAVYLPTGTLWHNAKTRSYFPYFRVVAELLSVLLLLSSFALDRAAAETRRRPHPAAAAETHRPPDPAPAVETRRAFLVGIQSYSDGYVQPLERAANDANDLARDLQEVGFDKKNIKVAVDLSSRDAFEKIFSDFLSTIQPGDDVVFYFSGHGFGVESDQTNYLLFTDLKSPFTYTKSQLSDQERRNSDVVRLKIAQYLDAYQKNEIPNGVSANDIERRIAEKIQRP